ASYTPFDKATITLDSPEHNADGARIESAQITLVGGSSSKTAELKETGPNTGVFDLQIKLSPDLSKFLGDLEVRRDDGITASFRIDADNIITETVLIVYHEAVASFDKISYSISDEAVITINDPDANRNSDLLDGVDVKIWSDTDPNGITLTLRETGASSGIFEEGVLFVLTDASSGNRLRVSDGDTLTARYVDNRLPQPAKLTADGIATIEVRNVLATGFFGKPVPSIEKAPASNPELVDSFGGTITQVFTGEQVLVQSEVVNTQSRKQPFAYIVQIKDSDGITISISWLTAELPPNDSLNVSQSWLPLSAGEYTIEVFVWEAIDIPTALSPSRIKNVHVIQ
ncbi:MAG: hypothetical protein ACE5JV_02560, partial [Nitrososphaerales archaeon]